MPCLLWVTYREVDGALGHLPDGLLGGPGDGLHRGELVGDTRFAG